MKAVTNNPEKMTLYGFSLIKLLIVKKVPD